uniref:HECT domain-containing protein n=1 Tax=Leptobrachium leishanense TaxID=445787 RepID=A0A8C5MMK1_9ANUR
MYCWGNNMFGQLGLADPEDTDVLFKENDFFQGKAEVQKVACGGQHTVFILDDGSIFSCGQNSNGQLGRRTMIRSTDQILALEAQTIVDASCGMYHSVSVCNQGNVFTWGEGTEGELGTGQLNQTNSIPRRISGLSNSKIIQVSCGHFHSIALSDDGRVFSWGSNKAGQLGLGKQTPNQARPQIVMSLHGMPLVQVTAGGSQSFALSMLGTVFGWGRNNAGQLGFRSDISKDGIFKPYAVRSLRNLGVAYISCGDEHTAVLTKEGNVYTFGDDTYGQLGQRSRNTTSVPQIIDEYKGQVSRIACGSYHTLIYAYTCNRVVSFGRGSQMQSHITSNDDQVQETHPQELNISSLVSSKDHMDPYVKWIFAGNNISFIYCTTHPQDPNQTPVTDSLQKISRVDIAMANKWLNTKPESEEYQEAKREINTIFSSPSCLTASFLKSRTDNPAPTCPVALDLDAASKIFAILQKDKRISEIICSSLKSDLIPRLDSLSVLYEALSIFILFPELPSMHLKENIVQLVVPFTDAVNNLSGNALKILGSMWSSMTAPALAKFIEVLKLAVICTIRNNEAPPKIRSPLEVLKRLYRINMKANCIVPIKRFCIDNLLIHPLDIVNWRAWQSGTLQDSESTPVIFCRYPFIFSFPSKLQILQNDSAQEKNAIILKAHGEIMQNRLQGSSELPKIPVFHLKVRRNNLIQDTMRKLSIAEDSEYKKNLLIEFHGETTANPPMVAREFFLQIFDAVINPDYGMFYYSAPLSTMWFPVTPSIEKAKYFYFGVLCGLAIFNQVVVHLPFPMAFFKKLLGKNATLDDLKELDPTFGKSLQIILDSDEVDNLQLYFRLCWENKTVDLIPNGTALPVNNSNKHDYVAKCVDYIFNTSVEQTFEEFKRGLYKVCDKDLLSFFQPEELKDVVVGGEVIYWDAFEKNSLYQGRYTPNHPTIGMFWKVFHALCEKDKKSFLIFVTGNARTSIIGLDCGRICISHLWSPDDSFLPEAQPCFNLLLLPEYSTIKIMKKKLLFAIQNCTGYTKN